LVSTVTPAIIAVFTVPAAAAAGLLMLPPPEAGRAAADPPRATAAASAGNLSLGHDFLSFVPGITYFFFAGFSWQLAPEGEHASFAVAQEYGREYRPAKCLTRPHVAISAMTSTLCSVRTSPHPSELIVVTR
jgi:hypothetical protein